MTAMRGAWLLVPALLAGCEAGTGASVGSRTAASAPSAADQAALNADLARFGISMTMNGWVSPAELSRRSGLPAGNVVSVGSVDGKRDVFFRPAGLSAPVIAAAPAKVCGAEGKRVLRSAILPLVHPGDMPGVQRLEVECT